MQTDGGGIHDCSEKEHIDRLYFDFPVFFCIMRGKASGAERSV
jgi:hypothetical protein